VEPINCWHLIAQWKRRRKQSRSSRCGARARWPCPRYGEGEGGGGGGEKEEAGLGEGVFREGGREEEWPIYSERAPSLPFLRGERIHARFQESDNLYRVFTIIIIFYPFWWLSYNKLFYLSLIDGILIKVCAFVSR